MLTRFAAVWPAVYCFYLIASQHTLNEQLGLAFRLFAKATVRQEYGAERFRLSASGIKMLNTEASIK